MKTLLLAACIVLGAVVQSRAEENSVKKPDPPAPATDRVGFPDGYQKFDVLRLKKDEKKQTIVTIYGNAQASAVTDAKSLPYAYGSVIVMETAEMTKDAAGKPALDEKGEPSKAKVTGLHVMRREKGFGEAYAENRSGEWEFVEYNADKSLKTPLAKSFACAECHIKAGKERDFVYRARLPEKLDK